MIEAEDIAKEWIERLKKPKEDPEIQEVFGFTKLSFNHENLSELQGAVKILKYLFTIENGK